MIGLAILLQYQQMTDKERERELEQHHMVYLQMNAEWQVIKLNT